MGVDDKPVTAHEASTFGLPAQFEESGHCKKAEGRREAQNCLQITKGELRPFLTIFGTSMRAVRLVRKQ